MGSFPATVPEAAVHLTAPTVSSLLRWERSGSYLGFSHGLGSTVWIFLTDDLRLRLRCGSLVRLGLVGKAEQIMCLDCEIFSLAVLHCVVLFNLLWSLITVEQGPEIWRAVWKCACMWKRLHLLTLSPWREVSAEVTVTTETSVTLANHTGSSSIV